MIENASKFKRGLRFFGKWIVTPLFAIGSGIISAVAVSSIIMFSGFWLPLMILILAATFLAETMVNIYLFKDSVPETLVELSSGNIYRGQGNFKKILLSFGIFCALGGGLSLAALTYTSGITAITAVLGLLTLSAAPVAIALASVLAVMGFFAITGLFIKWIAHAIKNDIHKQISIFFKEIFTRDIRKHIAQQTLEGFFKLLFMGIFVSLAVVGTIAFLGTMQKGLFNFLSLVPRANLFAVKIASCIISYGLMGVARTPWVVHSLCSVSSVVGEWVGKKIYMGVAFISRIFKKEQQLPSVNENSTTEGDSVVSSVIKISAVLVHGLCFGALAKLGGGNVLASALKSMKIPASTASGIGQTAALISGGTMAAGTSTFAFFPQLKPQNTERADPCNENLYLLSSRFVAPEDKPGPEISAGL